MALSWRAHGRAAHRLRETSTAVHVSRDTATRRASAGGRRMGPATALVLVPGHWTVECTVCRLFIVLHCKLYSPRNLSYFTQGGRARDRYTAYTAPASWWVDHVSLSVPGTMVRTVPRPILMYPDFKLSANQTPPAPATPETSTVPLTLPSEVANGRDRCLLSLLGPLLGLPEALDEFLLLCEEGRARHG